MSPYGLVLGAFEVHSGCMRRGASIADSLRLEHA